MGREEAVGAEDVTEGRHVSSHACVAVWPACCRLAASMRLPCQFGSPPSALKREGQFQKRLKLSIKLKLRAEQVDSNQELRLSILLKLSAPPPMGGISPDIKTDFLHLAMKFSRLLKLHFVSLDCLR